MMLPTNGDNLVKKSPKGYAAVGRLYAEILVKVSCWGPTPHPAPIGGKFGVEKPRQMSPQSVQRVARGAKNLKIATRVSEIPALCAARNAARKINHEKRTCSFW